MLSLCLVLLQFNFFQHFGQGLLENAAAEDPLEDRVTDSDISALELERFHDVFDACVSVSGQLFCHKHLGQLRYSQVNMFERSAPSSQREPLVDDVHLLCESGVSGFVDRERFGTSVSFELALSCFAVTHLGLLQVEGPFSGESRRVRRKVTFADDFIQIEFFLPRLGVLKPE